MQLRPVLLILLTAVSAAAILPDSFQTHSKGHLSAPTSVVVTTKGLPIPRARVERLAEQGLQGMQARLGLSLPMPNLSIEVYGTESAYHRAGGLGNTDACFLGPDRILLKGARGITANLSHEFAHVLIAAHTDDRCPAWLEEGIINHENHERPDGQYNPETIDRLENAVRTLARRSNSWSLESLSDQTQDTGDMDDQFYGAAWSATDYLYRVYGRGRVLGAMRRMGEMEPDDAFRQAFGADVAGIEREWRATLT